jgi:hypothetical protein
MAEDIKGEVEDKYGPVRKIKVDKMSRVSLPCSLWSMLGPPLTNRATFTSSSIALHPLEKLIKVLAEGSLAVDS